jgi:hypothetical protein
MKFFRFIGFTKQRNLYFTTLIFFKDSNNNSSPSRKDEQTGKKTSYEVYYNLMFLASEQNMKKCLTLVKFEVGSPGSEKAGL